MADFEITPDNVKSKMKIPAEMQKVYDAAVKNGLLLMFGKEMREQTADYMLSEEGAAPQKLADGIFSVVMFLYEKSNGTLPPQLAIPIGTELLAHAVDAARKAGIEVSNEDAAEGTSAFIEAVFKAAGATPEQMQQLLGGMDSGQALPAGAGAPKGV